MSCRSLAWPRQEKPAHICACSLLSKGPGQLPIWSIISCHARAPPLISSGRVYLPLTMNKLLQMLNLSQRSSPFLWAPIFWTRLWTIWTWKTEAHFLKSVFQKKGSRNVASTKWLSFKPEFLYITVMLSERKIIRRKSKLSAFQIGYLMMTLLSDGDLVLRGVCVHWACSSHPLEQIGLKKHYLRR